jgi:hypothetical protein
MSDESQVSMWSVCNTFCYRGIEPLKSLVSQRKYDQASFKWPWQKSARHCLQCLERVQWISIKIGASWPKR